MFFLQFLLYVCGKYMSSVSALVADNCNFNKSISSKFAIALIGGENLRFQFAVREIVDEYKNAFKELHHLAVKLRTVNCLKSFAEQLS